MKAVAALTADSFDSSSGRRARSCAEIPVLLIDGDEIFRAALSEILRDDGHPVAAYGSIAELPRLRKLSATRVLITDYQLPGNENGLTLARRFHAAHPGVLIVILTAYASHHLEHAVAGFPYVSLLHKPAQYEELHRLLHERQQRGPVA